MSKKQNTSPQRAERRRPVLIIQHAPHEHPAAIRRALESQGVQSLLIRPYLGESYPNLKEIRGLISMGGPMGANDEAEHPWIIPECELLRAAVEASLPTVGVCLGGQMMARALGGFVKRHTVAEVGWFPVQLNAEGKKDRILGSAGTSRPIVYQWHQDSFYPPKHAVLLATSQHCERQAYRIGERAYGFQFHPEADHQLVNEWLAIEGVETEIAAIQKEYGPKTVQSAGIQKNRALQGEKASLKLTTAIGQLFQTKAFEPAEPGRIAEIERWIAKKTTLILELEGADRRPFWLRGQILLDLSLEDGDFIVFKETNTLLWPIRIDHIRSIKAED